MPDFEYSTTPESSEVTLYEPEEIPWDEIAFRTVSATLRHFLEHRAADPIPVLNTAVFRPRS